MLDDVQSFLQPTHTSSFVNISANDFVRLYMKIESVRIPIVSGDKRPYVGEMVAADEDMGVDPSPFFNPALARLPYSYRFGGGHDGEHWLTKTVGAQIKATPGIKGLVLTYYYQESGLGNTMILLDHTNIVLLIKDLVTLGPKILSAKRSYPDNAKTKSVNETMFTDKIGKPLSKSRVESDDLIGTTTVWTRLTAQSFYPGYDRTFGTFHFIFLKYNKVQEYRSKVGHADKNLRGEGVADEDVLASLSEAEKKQAIPIDWFIPVLSPASPVRCFK